MKFNAVLVDHGLQRFHRRQRALTRISIRSVGEQAAAAAAAKWLVRGAGRHVVKLFATALMISRGMTNWPPACCHARGTRHVARVVDIINAAKFSAKMAAIGPQ